MSKIEQGKFKVVCINWVDSQIASFTWCHIDEVPSNIAEVSTVGFLISETKDIVTIASSLSLKENSENQVSSVINIPKCCIRSKKTISF